MKEQFEPISSIYMAISTIFAHILVWGNVSNCAAMFLFWVYFTLETFWWQPWTILGRNKSQHFWPKIAHIKAFNGHTKARPCWLVSHSLTKSFLGVNIIVVPRHNQYCTTFIFPFQWHHMVGHIILFCCVVLETFLNNLVLLLIIIPTM
jgi:hypothetical protein